MENTAYLRRQATFCLRLSQLCSDPPLAEYLRFRAAEFHEKALRAEFFALSDCRDSEHENHFMKVAAPYDLHRR
jgi:hypothetical protein